MSEYSTRLFVKIAIAFTAALGASIPAVAQSTDASRKPDEGKRDVRQGDDAKPPPRKFRPPPGAPPATRTKGAVRSGKDGGVPAGEVEVLAPKAVMGYTTRERPVLFWSLSQPTDQPVQITINDLSTGESVVDVTLSGEQGAGIHRFDTAKEVKSKDFKLEPGVQYEWVVLIPRPEGVNAKSAQSTCKFMRVDPAKAPKVAESAGAAERARTYADAGVWYDYLAALDDLITASPQDAAWREARDAALREQGLPTASGGPGVGRGGARGQ